MKGHIGTVEVTCTYDTGLGQDVSLGAAVPRATRNYVPGISANKSNLKILWTISMFCYKELLVFQCSSI